MELTTRVLLKIIDIAGSGENADTDIQDGDGSYDGAAAVPPDETGVSKAVSTSYFLSIACPGDNDGFGKNFENGEIHIDVARLYDFNLSQVVEGADIYLQFLDCHANSIIHNGASPGWIDDSNGVRIVQDLKPLSLIYGDMQFVAADVRANNFFVLASVKNHGYYRLGVTVKGSTVNVSVGAKDGSIVCSYGYNGILFLGCTSQDPDENSDSDTF
jgi:hypothetical protein